MDKNYKHYYAVNEKYVKELNRLWDDYYRYQRGYELSDVVDDIIDALTWTNIKKNLKRLTHYLR